MCSIKIAVLLVLQASGILAIGLQYCYDKQVEHDQFFDDSFVCNTNEPFPSQEIDSDFYTTATEAHQWTFLASTLSGNNSDFFTRTYSAPGDYAYSCVCSSNRRRVDRVYLDHSNDVCFVVKPEVQNVYYAQCKERCLFDYKTATSDPEKGYFCVNQNYVTRQFLVWCPKSHNGPQVIDAGFQQSHQAVGGHNQVSYQGQQPVASYGKFHILTKRLPTLCACRGYFCDNHSVSKCQIKG